MKVHVEMSEKEIKAAIYHYLEQKSGVRVPDNSITILVKSKQNYKSEWEQADIKAEFDAYSYVDMEP